MRVTESVKFANITDQIGQLRERYVKAAQQSSSGKRVSAPSDDPVAAAENARVLASLSQTESYRETIRFAKGDLELAESSLDSAGQVMQRAMELALTGSNSSTAGNQFQALAVEAKQLVDAMIAIGNTKGSQGYVFGGTRSEDAPFDNTGAYFGNDGERRVSIDGGPPTTVTVSGSNAFAPPSGRNVMQDLSDLAGALERGDSIAVRSLLGALGDSHDQIVQERAHTGVMLDRLSLTDSFLAQAGLNLTERASVLTDADAIESLSTLSRLETVLQQTVAVNQKLLQTSALTLSP
jgi:flagellar hook-associated protein 3 FlgL